MTDLVRQEELAVLWLDDRRATLTGPAGRVGAAIQRLRNDGRLARTTNPVPTGDGGVLVTVTVLPAVPERPPAPPPASPWTPRIVLGLVAVVGAIFITCGVLALRGLAWAGTHGALILGVFGAIVGVALLCTRPGRAAVSVVVSVIVK